MQRCTRSSNLYSNSLCRMGVYVSFRHVLIRKFNFSFTILSLFIFNISKRQMDGTFQTYSCKYIDGTTEYRNGADTYYATSNPHTSNPFTSNRRTSIKYTYSTVQQSKCLLNRAIEWFKPLNICFEFPGNRQCQIRRLVSAMDFFSNCTRTLQYLRKSQPNLHLLHTSFTAIVPHL